MPRGEGLAKKRKRVPGPGYGEKVVEARSSKEAAAMDHLALSFSDEKSAGSVAQKLKAMASTAVKSSDQLPQPTPF